MNLLAELVLLAPVVPLKPVVLEVKQEALQEVKLLVELEVLKPAELVATLVELVSTEMEYAIEKKLDGFTYGGLTRDSYGFYTWGDTFHWSWKNFGKSPKQTPEWMFSYAGNYYDYPHASLLQFVRTGDRQFFDRFEP